MKKILFLTVCVLLICCGAASVFPLYTGTPTLPGTQFEDDNLEFFVDKDGDRLISEGDVLISAIQFTKIWDLVGGAPEYVLDSSVDELVALATIQVLDMSGTSWIFGQYGDTPMVQVYTGGPTDLIIGIAGQDQSLANATAAVIDGTHLWDFSITNDPDTYWKFTPIESGANDPSIVAGILSATKVGVVNYQLNQVWGNDIFSPIEGFMLPGGDGLVDLVGSGDILGGRGLVGGAFARSDIDAIVNPIPEPATLTLFGFGLLSLAVVIRRRRS